LKAVLQRVQRGGVTVAERKVAEIKLGLVILLGVGPDDTRESAEALARKISRLRIFEDEAGKMNLSLLDAGGEALVVPQFTLFADTSRGNRPSFTKAGPPELAQPLASFFVECLEKEGIPTKEGEFGAHMKVEIINDGPVTIVLDYP
jgi:D-tyrosyl-tRNA(Tyr) deacylase